MTGGTKRKKQSGASCHGEEQGAARLALGVDTEIKAANLARLKRIEGQIRGLHKMVEEDRYCPDILTQLGAAQEALRGVARELVRNHLTRCVPTAIKAKSADAAEMAAELTAVFHGLTKQ
jgi:DNA-binding FrmR family transcriptional regulator